MDQWPDLRGKGKALTEAILGVLMEHELVIEYEEKDNREGSENMAVKYTIRKRGRGKTE